MDPLKLLKIVKKWKWTFLGVVLLAFGLIALAPAGNSRSLSGGKELDQFQSSAKILLTPPSGNTTAFGARGTTGVDMSQSWFADPAVLQEVMRSEELLKRVTDKAGGSTTWEALRNLVNVEPLSQGRVGVMMFNLSAVSNDPIESQKIVRLLTDEFSTYVQEISAREFASTRKFIEELVVEAEQRRLASEDKLMEFREKYLNSPSETQVSSQQMNLETRRMEVQQREPALEAQVASISAYLNGSVSTPPWAIIETGDGALAALEAQVGENRLNLEKQRETYTEESQNVVTAKERLARSEQVYNQGLREYAQSLLDSRSQELNQLRAQEGSISHELNSLLASQMSADDRRAVQKLERELSVWEENHLSLTQQLYQARVVEQSSRRQGSVTVLQQPLAGVPVIERNGALVRDLEFANRTRNRYKKLAMAFPFCLVLGAAAALLREYLVTSMKLRPRIEEALEVPVIAVIPAAASELTVQWEIFKRPMPGQIGSLLSPDKEFALSRKDSGEDPG